MSKFDFSAIELKFLPKDFKGGKLPQAGAKFTQSVMGIKTKFVVTENRGTFLMARRA